MRCSPRAGGKVARVDAARSRRAGAAHAVAFGRGPQGIGPAPRGVAAAGYGGIRLGDLLEEADIRQDERHALRRTYVVAMATDGYQAVFSWGELFNTPVGPGVVVAFERDAQPLRDGEGRIALVSTADNRIGVRHVKWLNRIDVRRTPE